MGNEQCTKFLPILSDRIQVSQRDEEDVQFYASCSPKIRNTSCYALIKRRDKYSLKWKKKKKEKKNKKKKKKKKEEGKKKKKKTNL